MRKRYEINSALKIRLKKKMVLLVRLVTFVRDLIAQLVYV